MRNRERALVAVALLVGLLPAAGFAAISPYSQDFELLFQPDPTALSNDGWVVYGNVFTPAGAFLYGYGPFPAPNDGFAFCQIDINQGGPDQGIQQMVVFSDYNNGDHAVGNLIESNVYLEFDVGAGDVGKTWELVVDAKRGNLVSPSTAAVFIKTLNPATGWTLTNFVTEDMTAIPETWGTYIIELAIDAGLVGQKFQVGFTNTATDYASSAIFYDNIILREKDLSGIPDGAQVLGATLGQNFPNPFNPTTRIDFSLEKTGHVELTVFDLAGRRVATLHRGELGVGEHHVDWDGRAEGGERVASGQYRYVLTTGDASVSRSMILVK